MKITRQICFVAFVLFWSASLPAADVPPAKMTRVALMDFSTDDNSYRSIQAAADFTGLVQLSLANEPGIEWVERAQISVAKAEFALAEMKAAGGASTIRRGRMLGANWLITGHFSKDDQEQHTLSFQVIDLEHADVVTSDTFVIADAAVTNWFGSKQVESAGVVLRRLLVEAKSRAERASREARLAFLFFADVGESRYQKDTVILQRELAEGLRREADANDRVRSIEFPKAYQSTEESEMVADGIIDPGQDSWKRTADLYVWGTYSVTNSHRAPFTATLSVVLYLWDGAAAPIVLNESLAFDSHEKIPVAPTDALIRRLVKRTMAEARIQPNKPDAPMVRRQIADSIVKTYIASDPGFRKVAFYRKEELSTVVQMLETACFFDPDNSDARVLWIARRYSNWAGFHDDLKNQFWTTFRCSQAWERYVERFGLAPATVDLSFGESKEIAGRYERSLKNVVDLFPQWHSQGEVDREASYPQQGVHTWLKEALGHGFPKDMPNDLAFKWKQAMIAELAQRKKRVQEYSLTKTTTLAQTNRANSQVVSSLPRSTSARPNSTMPSMPSSFHPRATVRTDDDGVIQMIPRPAWLADPMSIQRMFQLSPPNVLPAAVKSVPENVEFPSSFVVTAVSQLTYHDGQLWILATDRKSEASSDAKPDLSEEVRDEHSQLWRMQAGGTKPERYEPASLPAEINSFLFQGDQLWLAGSPLAVWDLKQRKLRKFSLAEGLGMREIDAMARADERIFVAGDMFELAAGTSSAQRWSNLDKPEGPGLSHGTGTPFALAANEQMLAYAAGGLFFHDFKTKTWTNAPAAQRAHCVSADGSTFWVGAENGLHAYDSQTHEMHSWNTPAVVESPMQRLRFMSVDYGGWMSRKQVEDMDGAIRVQLRKFAKDGRQVCVAAKKDGRFVDPVPMNSRIPGRVPAVLDDGEFLWVAAEYSGSRLLLIHKPSRSLVACVPLETRGRIVSLASSDKQIWVGTRYGEHPLVSFSKDVLLAVPRSRWVNLTLSTDDRTILSRTMNPRDQALYAFLAGDAQRVVAVVNGLGPTKLGPEEMILLALSYDALGVENAEQAEKSYYDIITRFPDTPWSRFAEEQLLENQLHVRPAKRAAANLARFDKNKDGRLDDEERRAMEADSGFRQEHAKEDEERLVLELGSIIKRYDNSKDGKLDRTELERLKIKVKIFAEAPKEALIGRTNSVGPFLTDKFPSIQDIFSKYDRDKDGSLNRDELKSLAVEIQSKR